MSPDIFAFDELYTLKVNALHMMNTKHSLCRSSFKCRIHTTVEPQPKLLPGRELRDQLPTDRRPGHWAQRFLSIILSRALNYNDLISRVDCGKSVVL